MENPELRIQQQLAALIQQNNQLLKSLEAKDNTIKTLQVCLENLLKHVKNEKIKLSD